MKAYAYAETYSSTPDSDSPVTYYILKYSLIPKIIIGIGINEGCKLIEEGVVSGYKVIDDVMSIGSRGQVPGPFISGKKNYKNLCIKLKDLAKKTGKNYLRPCDLMKSGDFLKMRR